ncbi:hypothetical protein ORV05_27410 [Amycolatopsis cynarae]|uniref:Uncharacterized protein n=1 Tax=Amycolatopsis cynarae TaxID=2995223 RepID=A0ABY7AZM5_9PSEU|nr:hypothetical protein [Amycolatopsis sp. HUAS 11-8]WAL64659.1 hypothetical protein ORV05_27410 [Amycolatopsis sp. HUAS 11-8]
MAQASDNLAHDAQELFSHLSTEQPHHHDGPLARPSYENLFRQPLPSAGRSRHESTAPAQR